MSTTVPPRSVARTRALWTAQILLGVFMVVASSAPKLVGEATAVEMFVRIGLGDWFRYLVGVLELLGGAGLLVRRTSGAAALGLTALMVGAAWTQAFVLHGGALVVTPVVIGLLSAVIAWARRDELTDLLRPRADRP